MRRFLVVLAAALSASGVVAVSVVGQSPEAETTLSVKIDVFPKKAGTPKHPQPIKIKSSLRLSTTEGFEKPIVTAAELRFGRAGTSSYNAGLFPRCSEATLNRYGTEGCPKRSRIGGGRASAYADTIITYPRIELFNGGPKLGLAYITLYRPALVQIAIPARIREVPNGIWKYLVSFKIPPVLQIVAGVPVAPRTIDFAVGRGKLITATGCPKSRIWPYEVEMTFLDIPSVTNRAELRCRSAD